MYDQNTPNVIEVDEKSDDSVSVDMDDCDEGEASLKPLVSITKQELKIITTHQAYPKDLPTYLLPSPGACSVRFRFNSFHNSNRDDLIS